MSSRGEGLLFAGPTGCGKTHLAAAIGNALLEDGRRVVFKRVTDLYYELRGSFDGGNSETDIITPCRQADLLILDDLEADAPTLGRAAPAIPGGLPRQLLSPDGGHNQSAGRGGSTGSS